MIYVLVFNIPPRPGLGPWPSIEAGFYYEGDVERASNRTLLSGLPVTQPLYEGAVYSFAADETRDGRMIGMLHDRYNTYINVASQKVLAKRLKPGMLYIWDLTLSKLRIPLPWLSMELPTGLTLPAGEPFTIPLTLREGLGNPGQIRLTRGGTTLWEGDIAAGQTLPLELSDTMPYDNLSQRIEAEAMEPVQGTWHSVGGVRQDVLAGFPRLRLRASGFPEISAAGKGYSGSLEVINEGFKGIGKLLLGSDVLAEGKFEAGGYLSHSFSRSMPHDDVLLGFRVQSLGRNKELVETGYIAVPVKAGFPNLEGTAILYEPSVTPGETAEVKVKANNAGYVGTVQLDITDTVRQERVTSEMRELAAGEALEVTYSAEMPPVESWSLRTRPQWVGRNRAITEGVPSLIGIAARNVLFEYTHYQEQKLRFVGGETTNPIRGIIAADQLVFTPKFQALSAPEIPGLPQAAAFALDLEPGDHEEIAFTNQRYFRMESEQEIAIVKNGQLVARKSTSTESGTLPAFAADRVAVFFTARSRRATRVA